jgi:predicted transposase/invertase (TIGR01784 family)
MNNEQPPPPTLKDPPPKLKKPTIKDIPEFVRPCNNGLFKRMFKLPEHREALKQILEIGLKPIGLSRNDILDIKIDDPEISPETAAGKHSVFDIKLTATIPRGNVLADIEMQVYVNGFRDRSAIYLAQLTASGIQSGDEYLLAVPAVTINILKETLFDEKPDYYASYSMRCDQPPHDELVTGSATKAHFVELSKIEYCKETIPKELYELLSFINAETKQEVTEMEQTMQNPVITGLAHTTLAYNNDPEVANGFRQAELAERIEQYLRIRAKEEGVAEGEARGETRGEVKATMAAIQGFQELGVDTNKIYQTLCKKTALEILTQAYKNLGLSIPQYSAVNAAK